MAKVHKAHAVQEGEPGAQTLNYVPLCGAPDKITTKIALQWDRVNCSKCKRLRSSSGVI